jgi:hypothetical protein
VDDLGFLCLYQSLKDVQPQSQEFSFIKCAAREGLPDRLPDDALLSQPNKLPGCNLNPALVQDAGNPRGLDYLDSEDLTISRLIRLAWIDKLQDNVTINRMRCREYDFLAARIQGSDIC